MLTEARGCPARLGKLRTMSHPSRNARLGFAAVALILGGVLSGCSPQADTCEVEDAQSWGLPSDAAPSFAQVDGSALSRAGLDGVASGSDVICTAQVTGDVGQDESSAADVAQVIYLSSSLDAVLDDLEAAMLGADLSPQGQPTDQRATWASADGGRGVSAYANEDGSTLIASYGF